MSFRRAVLWFLIAAALILLAVHLTANEQVTDSFRGFFLTLPSWLPAGLDFERVLIVLTVFSLLVAGLALVGCATLFMSMRAQSLAAHHRGLGQAAASQREIGHIKEQHQRQYEQVLAVGQALTKQLDKRVLVQTMVEVASRVTSVSQANSIVSLWLWNFETDTIRFEMGLYCDATLFTQTEFQPTELPFSRVVSTQKPWVVPAWKDQLTCISPEKASRLDPSHGVMLVPLTIERSVLGILMFFCHPDVLKSYEEQQPFYDVMWGELALALAIASVGDVKSYVLGSRQPRR